MGRISVLIFMLGFSCVSLAQTSLWKVSKDKKHAFIGGTIHVLAKSDYPLPKAFNSAYEQSASLVFETDISAMNAPEFQQKMLLAMAYQDGTTLKSRLQPSTYQALHEYCLSIGMPLEGLQIFKPGMLVVTLLYVELQRLGMAEAGVDDHFTSRARADGKKLDQLETVEAQLGFLADLGKGHENELILQTMQDMKKLPDIMNKMKSAWRNGESRKLADLVLKDMKQDFPGIYNDIVLERNNAWVPVIENMVKTPEVEFILVGVAHLVGEDGVIRQLKKRGYIVEQL